LGVKYHVLEQISSGEHLRKIPKPFSIVSLDLCDAGGSWHGLRPMLASPLELRHHVLRTKIGKESLFSNNEQKDISISSVAYVAAFVIVITNYGLCLIVTSKVTEWITSQSTYVLFSAFDGRRLVITKEVL
jgi:hypothetical protein